MKYILFFILISNFALSQTYLSDLEYADTSNYMILTDSIGEPYYIHKDSLLAIINAGVVYIDTFTIVNDTLRASIRLDGVAYSYVDLVPYEESQIIIDTAGILRSDLTLDIIQPSEPQRADSNYLIFDQINTDTIEWYLSGPIFGDQLLELDGNLLSITGGNTVDLTDIVPRIDGAEMELSASSYTPSFTLPTDTNRINVYLNGVRLWLVTTPAHIGEYSITGNTIYFFEALDNDKVSILIF